MSLDFKLWLHNETLLMKNLDNFFTKVDMPWVKLIWSQYYGNGKVTGNSRKCSFWWRSGLSMLNTFKGLAKTDYSKGDTILFWHDLWNGQLLKASFPHLYSFVKNENVTVKTVLEMESFDEHFHLPLSEIAFEQYCELSLNLQSLPDGERDGMWSFIWGNGMYSVDKLGMNIDTLLSSGYGKPVARQKVFFCCF
jgi:hypothetical protein